jgi:hypothetical protein
MTDLDIKFVVKSAISLLDSDNVITASESFKADTPEKEIAKEYVLSYSQFLKDIVDRDLAKGRTRADHEIREFIGHINSMLKNKQPDVFMKMVLNAPKHYKTMIAMPTKLASAPGNDAKSPASLPLKKK